LDGEWRDQSTSRAPEPGWRPKADINYPDAIFTFMQIFEFAARLAQSRAGSVHMCVEIAIKDLEGRRLSWSGTEVWSDDEYHTEMPEWVDRWDGPQTELIAKPRELAAQSAQKFFARFGLDVSLETLGQVQEDINHR